jgi:hypothetical protein
VTFTSIAPPCTFGAPRPIYPEPAYTVDPGPSGKDYFRGILAAVCAKRGVSPADVIGPSRQQYVVRARHEVIWTMRQARKADGKRRFSDSMIAQWVNRERSVMVTAAKSHENWMGIRK